MSVRAKFNCQSIDNATGDDSDGLKVIKLNAVYSDDPDSDNGKFFKWTPSGTIELGVVNPSASAQFEVGKEYYVDFSPAG